MPGERSGVFGRVAPGTRRGQSLSQSESQSQSQSESQSGSGFLLVGRGGVGWQDTP